MVNISYNWVVRLLERMDISELVSIVQPNDDHDISASAKNRLN